MDATLSVPEFAAPANPRDRCRGVNQGVIAVAATCYEDEKPWLAIAVEGLLAGR